MPAPIDLTGRKYGRLTVLKKTDLRKRERILWLCRCDCGNPFIAAGADMTSGNTRSCGCLHMDTITTHGHARRNKITSAFRRWQNMLSRCYNNRNQRFERYGARGIGVCQRWRDSFDCFLQDMGDCPPGMTIERIDNDGDYTPDNCRWASRMEQSQNQSSNRLLTHNGETRCMSEWVRITGIPHSTMRKRLKCGLPIERVLNPKKRRRHDSTS